ncbi:MAG: bifunctional riboflavin kinase/FAD synthetase [Tunicatimonas sp.]
MKVHRGDASFEPPRAAVVTSGTFDGVHVGHQKILRRLKELARETGGETVVVTYWPHPRIVLYPDDPAVQLLTTFDEKLALLEALGIDHLVQIPFTKEFSRLSSDAFVRQVLVDKIATRQLVIGYDHHFGRNREGGFEYLKEHAAEYGFTVEEIPRQDVDQVGVSSTKIRNALEAGQVHTTREYLGRPYRLTGAVVQGDQLGRQLGYPTANLRIDSPHKLIPADGIYAVHLEHADQRYEGMLYIGHRPTIQGTSRNIEVNIFDFNQSIYGDELRVDLLARTRGDMTFDGLEALTAQMKEDEKVVIELLKQYT